MALSGHARGVWGEYLAVFGRFSTLDHTSMLDPCINYANYAAPEFQTSWAPCASICTMFGFSCTDAPSKRFWICAGADPPTQM